jgi:hypothetical protein
MLGCPSQLFMRDWDAVAGRKEHEREQRLSGLERPWFLQDR